MCSSDLQPTARVSSTPAPLPQRDGLAQQVELLSLQNTHPRLHHANPVLRREPLQPAARVSPTPAPIPQRDELAQQVELLSLQNTNLRLQNENLALRNENLQLLMTRRRSSRSASSPDSSGSSPTPPSSPSPPGSAAPRTPTRDPPPRRPRASAADPDAVAAKVLARLSARPSLPAGDLLPGLESYDGSTAPPAKIGRAHV